MSVFDPTLRYEAAKDGAPERLWQVMESGSRFARISHVSESRHGAPGFLTKMDGFAVGWLGGD